MHECGEMIATFHIYIYLGGDTSRAHNEMVMTAHVIVFSMCCAHRFSFGYQFCQQTTHLFSDNIRVFELKDTIIIIIVIKNE